MIVLNGKLVSEEIQLTLKNKVDKLIDLGIIPCLSVILVGDNFDSIKYVNAKRKVCETLNINPLGVISSGCLLIICEEKDSLSIVNKLNLSGINGKIIGKTTKSLNRNIIKTDGSKEKLERFDQDEIIKIFE